MRLIVVLAIVLGTADAVYAQAAATPPVKLGDVVVSGSLRVRAEAWNWFQGNANDDYVYSGNLARLGFTQTKKRYDWQVEFAVPFLLGLPDDAIAAAPQGQLGFGAAYFAANDKSRNAGELFIKQGTIRVKGLGGIDGQSVKAGRIEFIDGTEVAPGNATLVAVKRDRIAHRLLGNFVFTHVGRSFDGVQYVLSNKKLNFTFLGARPTRGVFQVDGWGELDVNVFYGALTRQTGTGPDAGEWRVVGIGYRDYRDGVKNGSVLKAENRPAAARSADKEPINIVTFGGHYLRTVPTSQGVVDFLAWGVVQTGSWGTLDHRAGAFAAEAGWQPQALKKVAPWFRGGYNYGSGDDDPNDGRHGTFFQILPTPRPYARFPFFNMMNTGDGFGEVILRPSGSLKNLSLRTDVHVLRLANEHDLWYVGGGAFQPSTFGFTGRPSNGQSGLATLYDVSGDYRLNGYASFTVYYGHAEGRPVTEAIYPNGSKADLGYVELNLRF